MTTYYILTPSGYVPADPQPVVVPEGYMVVKRELDAAMQMAGVYLVKLGPGITIEDGIYRAMTQAGELK